MGTEDLKTRWWKWHRENPHVWEAFERFALQAWRAGKVRTSAWLIVNRIRWEQEIETKVVEGSRSGPEAEFKISNDFIALYARLFLAEHPECGEFFVVKESKRF